MKSFKALINEMKDEYVVIKLKSDKFISDNQLTDEADATLVRGGVMGTPDFNKKTIKIYKKDLSKAKKILKNANYKHTIGK